MARATKPNVDHTNLDDIDFRTVFQPGHIVSLTGKTVPTSLHTAFWIVEKVFKSSMHLSRPYQDRECTQLWAHDCVGRPKMTRQGFKRR